MTRFLLGLLVCGTCFAPVLVQPYRFASSSLTLPTITSGTYVLQLVADDLTAGAAVSAWSSRVGGWSAAQGTSAKRPMAVASSVGGRTAVEFDKVDDALTVTSFNPGGLSAVTVFIVANLATSATTDMIVELSANINVNNNAFAIYKTSADKLFLYAQQSGDVNAFETTASAAGADYVFSALDNKSLGSNQATLWIDGTSAGTRLPNAVLGGTFATYDLFIGGRGGTSLFVGMKLAALIICSGALDTTDRQAIENALMDYY